MTKHTLLLAIILALLSACGFAPRGQMQHLKDIGPVRVVNNDPYSALTGGLQMAIQRQLKTEAAEGASSATLRIHTEVFNTLPLAIDQFAQVREYITRYTVAFELLGSDGAVLMAKQNIDLSREYTYDITVSAGNPAEQEVIQRELRRDMQAAILRKMDLALRSKP